MQNTTQAAPVNLDIASTMRLMTCHAADRFEQLGALCVSLQAMLRSPQFYDSPWLASAQLDAMLALTSESAATVDAMAELHGITRDSESTSSALRARAQFIRSLHSQAAR